MTNDPAGFDGWRDMHKRIMTALDDAQYSRQDPNQIRRAKQDESLLYHMMEKALSELRRWREVSV